MFILRALLWLSFKVRHFTEWSLNLINKFGSVPYDYLLKALLFAQADKLKALEKFNVGCGHYFIKDWLNITFYGDFYEGIILRQDTGAFFLNLDINKAATIFSGNIKCVYASHFIEHLTYDEGLKFLRLAYSGMRKGGAIRLTCPDLTLWTTKYYENDMAFFNTYKRIYLQDQDVKSKGDIFMRQLFGGGHKACYDSESLKSIMEKAGFSQISEKKQFESAIPEIREIEPSSEGRSLETLYVEAFKE